MVLGTAALTVRPEPVEGWTKWVKATANRFSYPFRSFINPTPLRCRGREGWREPGRRSLPGRCASLALRRRRMSVSFPRASSANVSRLSPSVHSPLINILRFPYRIQHSLAQIKSTCSVFSYQLVDSTSASVFRLSCCDQCNSRFGNSLAIHAYSCCATHSAHGISFPSASQAARL